MFEKKYLEYPENKKSIKVSNEMTKTDHMTILASYSLLDSKVDVRKARKVGESQGGLGALMPGRLVPGRFTNM
jgi:hypothetical protein